MSSAELKAEINAKLSVERHGVTLGSGLIDVLTSYFVDVVVFKDVNEIEIDQLLPNAEDAWVATMSGELPKPHRDKIRKWVSNKAAPPPPPHPLGPSSVVSSAAEEDEEEDETELFGVKGPTSRDLIKLATYKAKQSGMSGARMLRLSFAIELGRVVSVGELIGSYVWGADPRLSKLAKEQKKAGMPTMSSIMSESSSKRRDLNTHFTGLIREFSEMGCINESNLITQFWAETQSVSPSDIVMCDYITQFFKKYPGVGLPEVVDILISSRCSGAQGSGGGATPEQYKEVKGDLKTTKAELKEVKSELTSVRSQLDRLVRQVAGLGKAPGAEGDPRGPKCHKCGEFGHIARNCPNKKKNKDEEKDDEEGE
jgi:hypothetical protein